MQKENCNPLTLYSGDNMSVYENLCLGISNNVWFRYYDVYNFQT